MIENRWNDAELAALIEAAGPDPADQALAERVYSSRLIGSDPDLVMHGGGNTSVKVTRRDLFGRPMRVLHIKGSGWDLASIEAAGLPGVRLDPLLELRALERLSDSDMVNVQRLNLLDSSAPTPSVETLLHAFLPHATVDHTHATAMMALADLPEAAQVVAELYGDRVAVVPYALPGFRLAKLAAEVFEANPQVEGLLLLKHGHFTFRDEARRSYELMLEHVNAAAEWFAAKAPPARAKPARTVDVQALFPALRGALAGGAGGAEEAMPVFDLRQGGEITAFLARDDRAELARRGTATPDHVLRTRTPPLLLEAATLDGGRAALDRAVAGWVAQYRARFERNAPLQDEPKTMLRPLPGLAWVPDLGLIGIGEDARAAAAAADLGVQTLQVMHWAEGAGGYQPLGEAELFECEYWSLEQAKLGKTSPPPMRGQVVLVSGGAGAIGLACAQAFRARGAQLFLVDRDAAALERALATLGAGHDGLACDLTEPGAAARAVAACVARFGGLDILLANAGAAWTGELAALEESALRASFELNFFAHQALAQASIAVLRAQGRGGQVLFNISKQSVNPGRNFGAYGLPKAASLFLLRQYALELGAEGIRVNGVNADRIRSGLLDDDFIAARARARGVAPDDYMAGNLLGREVEARHVAEAFVALAQAERTTGHVMTVDGGNVEAQLR
jgi:rhamnose utilization protein RhaD (predicted bifunctional aldolase and dehydrogenase)/NAD(P)-dependent dehydrogenase (short-subunit alcohol dehydrogenase family)